MSSKSRPRPKSSPSLLSNSRPRHGCGPDNLAVLYEYGRGTEQDTKRRPCNQQAAEQGDPWAQNNLGYLYSHGKGLTQSDEHAMHWYKSAAEQGHFQAQYNIASRYAAGQGVDVNLIEAHFWFKRATIGATALNQERVNKAIEHLERYMEPEAIQAAQFKFKEYLNG